SEICTVYEGMAYRFSIQSSQNRLRHCSSVDTLIDVQDILGRSNVSPHGSTRRYCVRASIIVRGAFVIAAVIVPLFLRILEPAAAGTLSDDSTTPSTTTARPLPLPNPDGGTKSSSLVFSSNVPMTSSSSSSSIARGGCTPPNPRTGELGSSPTFPGLRLPPPPSTDASIVPLPAYSPAPVSVLAPCTTENVPSAPVDRSFAAVI
ncbi:hypothetical protein EDB86DRAFT_2967712, partial [Lactarius hatsudake]